MNEFINQIIHFCIGFAIAMVNGFKDKYIWTTHLDVFYVSFAIETCQYMYNDNGNLKLADRLLDLFSYQLGAACANLIHHFVIRRFLNG